MSPLHHYSLTPCAPMSNHNHCRMLKDDRVRSEQLPSIFDVKEASYKLG